MSLKVPKANNMQLFKEGYKMSSGTFGPSVWRLCN